MCVLAATVKHCLAETETLSCVLHTNFEVRLAFAFCNWGISASITQGCTTDEKQQSRTDIQ